jgi:hypothetical protein
MAQRFFQLTNPLAPIAWIKLVMFPGRKLISDWLCAVVVPGLLALGYAAVIAWKLATNEPPETPQPHGLRLAGVTLLSKGVSA